MRILMYQNTYKHYNRAHCGTMILSMSKRIMNEVMGIANDFKIPIYYQDTDSMHLLAQDVKGLGKLYKARYVGSEKRNDGNLIGSCLGQFHNDLELNGKDAVSKKCYILGKKCYLDVLENTSGEKGYHIRMKGVGSKCILAHCDDPEEVYETLIESEKLKFDLVKGGVKFETILGERVKTKVNFEREIYFPGEYIHILGT